MTPVGLMRAALLSVLLVFIPLLAFTTRPIQADEASASQATLVSNLAAGRLMQALYQIERESYQSGWTAKNAHTAAVIWGRMGDTARALPYWELAVSLDASEQVVARGLADAYLQLHQWPQAEDALSRLLTLAPEDTWTHYQLGVLQAAFDPRAAYDHLLVAAGDPLYSEVSFELLTSIGEDSLVDPTFAMEVGLILGDHSLWPYAEVAFQQAADLGEPFPEALAFVGLARDQQRKDGGEVISRAVALAPANPQVRYVEGLHLRGVADYSGSLEAFFRAMASDPNSPAYAAELGEAYRLVGDFAVAEEWLKAAVTLSNNDPRFQSLLDAFYASLTAN